MKLTETGDLEGKLTVTYTGLEASQRRIEERLSDDTDRKKFLEDEVKEAIPIACDVELTNQPDWKGSDRQTCRGVFAEDQRLGLRRGTAALCFR